MAIIVKSESPAMLEAFINGAILVGGAHVNILDIEDNQVIIESADEAIFELDASGNLTNLYKANKENNQ